MLFLFIAFLLLLLDPNELTSLYANDEIIMVVHDGTTGEGGPKLKGDEVVDSTGFIGIAQSFPLLPAAT